MWYVIEAEPGAKLIYGLKAGVDKEQFAQAIKDGTISSLLQTVEVNPGDVFDIPAGLVHGIGEGILLAEIQRNSNLAYRIYDYDRVDAQGNKRPLQVDKALEVIDFSAKASGKLRPELQDVAQALEKATLVAKKYFVVGALQASWKASLRGPETASLSILSSKEKDHHVFRRKAGCPRESLFSFLQPSGSIDLKGLEVLKTHLPS